MLLANKRIYFKKIFMSKSLQSISYLKPRSKWPWCDYLFSNYGKIENDREDVFTTEGENNRIKISYSTFVLSQWKCRISAFQHAVCHKISFQSGQLRSMPDLACRQIMFFLIADDLHSSWTSPWEMAGKQAVPRVRSQELGQSFCCGQGHGSG